MNASAAARRIVIVACCLGAPAVASAIALTTLETYRLIAPSAALFGGPPPATLAESIAKGAGVEQTYQFIRGGQDPNAVISVDDQTLTGGTPLTVSPLMLAVAAKDGAAVEMLLGFGASLDAPGNRHVHCLARDVANQEVLDILAAHSSGVATPPCEDRRDDGRTPLVAWSE